MMSKRLVATLWTASTSMMMQTDHSSILHIAIELRLVCGWRVCSIFAGSIGSTGLPGIIVAPWWGRYDLIAASGSRVLGDSVEIDLFK